MVFGDGLIISRRRKRYPAPVDSHTPLYDITSTSGRALKDTQSGCMTCDLPFPLSTIFGNVLLLSNCRFLLQNRPLRNLVRALHLFSTHISVKTRHTHAHRYTRSSILPYPLYSFHTHTNRKQTQRREGQHGRI